MGDNNLAAFNDPAANPGAGAFDKGKGKATEDPSALEMSMDEEEESDESENEEVRPIRNGLTIHRHR